MTAEKCSRCHRSIKSAETPYVLNNSVVCHDCYLQCGLSPPASPRRRMWVIAACAAAAIGVFLLVWIPDSMRKQEDARLKKEQVRLEAEVAKAERNSKEQFQQTMDDYDADIRISNTATKMFDADVPRAEVEAWEEHEREKLLDAKRHRELIDAIKNH